MTDGSTHSDPRGCCDFWVALDEMVMAMGFVSIWSKFKLPRLLLMVIAHICDFIGMILGIRIKLNPFAVKVLTMHRWFDISAAEKGEWAWMVASVECRGAGVGRLATSATSSPSLPYSPC